MKEIQETIPLEFNFEREVAFMRIIKANLRAHGFDCFVVCPSAVVDLCTPRMIVMEVGRGGRGGEGKGRGREWESVLKLEGREKEVAKGKHVLLVSWDCEVSNGQKK